MRKVVHGTGNVILLAWWLHIPLGAASWRVQSLYCLTNSPFCPVSIVSGRQSLGTFFYAVSIGLLVAWFWPVQQPQYAVLGSGNDRAIA